MVCCEPIAMILKRNSYKKCFIIILIAKLLNATPCQEICGFFFFLKVLMLLTKKWQMKSSFPDIFTSWKLNQVLPPSETVTIFLQAPRACFLGGFLCVGNNLRGWHGWVAEAEMVSTARLWPHRFVQESLPQRIH